MIEGRHLMLTCLQIDTHACALTPPQHMYTATVTSIHVHEKPPLPQEKKKRKTIPNDLLVLPGLRHSISMSCIGFLQWFKAP